MDSNFRLETGYSLIMDDGQRSGYLFAVGYPQTRNWTTCHHRRLDIVTPHDWKSETTAVSPTCATIQWLVMRQCWLLLESQLPMAAVPAFQDLLRLRTETVTLARCQQSISRVANRSNEELTHKPRIAILY
jgi:hypothetical protein